MKSEKNIFTAAGKKLTLGTAGLSAKRWSSTFHPQKLRTETGINDDNTRGENKQITPTITMPVFSLQTLISPRQRFHSYFCRGVRTHSLPACPEAPRGPRRKSWEPLCWLVTGNPGRPRLRQQTDHQWADSNIQRGNTLLLSWYVVYLCYLWSGCKH